MCADKLGRICLDILKGTSLAFDHATVLGSALRNNTAIYPTFSPSSPPSHCHRAPWIPETTPSEIFMLTIRYRQVVTRAPDPHRPALRPGAPQRAEPGRPPRDGRREALQGERGRRAARQPRVDREVRQRLATACIAGAAAARGGFASGCIDESRDHESTV